LSTNNNISSNRKIILYRKYNSNVKIKKNIVLIILILIILAYLLLFSSIFNIKEISIYGNSVTSETQITTIIPKNSKNIFRYRIKKSIDAISSIPMIDNVKIYKKIPNKIQITVTECIPILRLDISASEDKQNILILDNKLKILYTSSSRNNVDQSDLTMIKGLSLSEYELGKNLNKFVQSNQSRKCEDLIQLIDKLKSFNLFENVKLINIENVHVIFIILKNDSKLKFGEITDLDRKINAYLKISSKIDKSVKIELDLSIPGRYFLK